MSEPLRHTALLRRVCFAAGGSGLTGFTGLAVLASCTSFDSSFDKSAMLTRLAGDVMAPHYTQLEAQAVLLQTSMVALCDAPTPDRLDDAQAAWSTARKPWKQAEMHGFGPVKDLYSRSDIDWYPAEPDKIDLLLQGTAAITPETLSLQGAGVRGFNALEYLLFSPNGQKAGDVEGDEEILLSLSGDDVEATHRCEFLFSASSLLTDAATELASAWLDPTDEEMAFSDTFAQAGQSSTRYTSIQSAINELINAIIFGLEDMADEKLGMPLGMNDGGTLHPELIQSSLSGNAITDIRSNLEGLLALYRGTLETPPADSEGELSLSGLVRSRKSTIDDRIQQELQDAIDAVDAIPEPLSEALTQHTATVQTAWDKIKVVQTSFTADVAALLGVTLTFNDNDGD